MYSEDDGRPLRAWLGAKANDGEAVSWAELFTNESIVGTVSQSGGTPTGAVIERGSNANGEYVRFADGTQICTHSGTTSNGTAIWSYPAAFSVKPAFQATVQGSPGFAFSPGTGNSTGITVVTRDHTNASIDEKYSAVAVGRWF